MAVAIDAASSPGGRVTLTLDRTDTQLEDRVRRQLASTRDVDAHDIGVHVAGGRVTLIGTVRSLPEKMAAAAAVKPLFGVRAIVNDITVSPAQVDDADLTRAVGETLRARAGVPAVLTASVLNGIVTLEGSVRWLYERSAAEAAVAYLPGVRGIDNRIALTSIEPSTRLCDEIEQALLRTAGLDWKRISVTAEGGKVRLSGAVFSLMEKEQAEHAAWAHPGVASVESRLEVASRRWW
jgi:osmotically-inducible protein OsmY